MKICTLASTTLLATLLVMPATAQEADHRPATEEQWPTAKKVVFGGLLAGTAVGLGVATVFWIQSAGKGSDADAILDGRPAGFCQPGESRAACLAAMDEHETANDEQDDAAFAAWMAYAAGGVAAAGAIATVVFWENERAPRTAVQVAPTPSGVYLGVSHAF